MEAEGLGTWQVRLSRALHQVLGCEKTYVAQFAESEGFAHVHFHVIGRPRDLPYELRGHRIFQLLNSSDRPPVSARRMDEIAGGVARYLALRR
jgi:diadenosine tetraphosphate (Ap4A) HIT family hydrolase